MQPSHLPLIVLIENPEKQEAKQGVFAQLLMQRVFITDLYYTQWSISIQRTIDGQKMSVEYQELNIRIDELVSILFEWRHELKYVYLTEEAAKELLPEMCMPRAPFALAVENPELQELCLKGLKDSLYFPK